MNENKKKEFFRVIKFTLFSISAALIELVSFTILNELFFKDRIYAVPYLISLLLSIIWNFTLNRNFTFKSASNVKVAMAKTLLFYVIFTPIATFGGEYLSKRINEYIVKGMTMIINFVGEYLYQRFYVFKDSIETKIDSVKN